MLVDALHSQTNRFSGSVEMFLPFRSAGVAQVAAPSSVTLCRKPDSQESSQSQLKGLSRSSLQIEIRDACQTVSI